MLSLDKIYHAAFILKSVARKTDLIAAPHLSEGNNLYLKTENLQVTGSFKVPAARCLQRWHRLLQNQPAYT